MSVSRPTGAVERLPLTGDYVQPAGFGANGIRALAGGQLVVVSGGVLYAVDPSTGVADRIEVAGRALTGGDGLELRGRTLYVVQNRLNVITKIALNRSGTAGTVVSRTGDPHFDVPTTIGE